MVALGWRAWGPLLASHMVAAVVTNCNITNAIHCINKVHSGDLITTAKQHDIFTSVNSDSTKKHNKSAKGQAHIEQSIKSSSESNIANGSNNNSDMIMADKDNNTAEKPDVKKHPSGTKSVARGVLCAATKDLGKEATAAHIKVAKVAATNVRGS